MNTPAAIPLNEQVILITGSSRNIGLAIALEFAKYGAKIVINARSDTKSAQAAAQAVTEAGGEAMLILADVGIEHQVQAMIDQVLTVWGKISVLVNNAGLRRSCALTSMSTAEWREVMAVNLDGPFFCCRAVVPSMINSNYGTIINISGLNAHIGRDRWSHVCASKTGAIGLTRALAVELAPHKITVNHIIPGPIATERSHSSDMLETAKRIAGVPIGRLGHPSEIAALCVFLASENSRFITGQTLHINGGALRC
ncbi:hypothetical protein TI04_04580 [Achromatium sp. WMS2]|nr:hypothetical protein TI04_04580 [Achromatium sp. WMS2]